MINYSLQELLNTYNIKINELIDNVNLQNNYIEWLKEIGIKDEVIKQIEKLINESDFNLDGGIF